MFDIINSWRWFTSTMFEFVITMSSSLFVISISINSSSISLIIIIICIIIIIIIISSSRSIGGVAEEREHADPQRHRGEQRLGGFTPSPPTKSFPIQSPWVKLPGDSL